MRWTFWAFLLVESFLICASLTIKPIPVSSIKCSQASVCPPCSFSTQLINAIMIMTPTGMIRIEEGKYFVLSSIHIVWTTAVRVMGDAAVTITHYILTGFGLELNMSESNFYYLATDKMSWWIDMEIWEFVVLTHTLCKVLPWRHHHPHTSYPYHP